MGEVLTMKEKREAARQEEAKEINKANSKILSADFFGEKVTDEEYRELVTHESDWPTLKVNGRTAKEIHEAYLDAQAKLEDKQEKQAEKIESKSREQRLEELKKLSKADLVVMANEVGVESVPDSMTKQEIAELILTKENL